MSLRLALAPSTALNGFSDSMSVKSTIRGLVRLGCTAAMSRKACWKTLRGKAWGLGALSLWRSHLESGEGALGLGRGLPDKVQNTQLNLNFR